MPVRLDLILRIDSETGRDNVIHRKVENPALVQQGARIAYERHGRIEIGIVLRRESGILVISNGLNPHWEPIYIRLQKYLYTIVSSPDLEHALGEINKEVRETFKDVAFLEPRAMALAIKIWNICEQHYGIDVDGSKPKDVRRTVAFLILKGDKPALDTATDILGG